MIYHITSEIAWEQAQKSGAYQGDTLFTEGFIHTSTLQQVNRTANKFYTGKTGLVVLEIDESKLIHEVKYEGAVNGELFPHIYGDLNLNAVVRVLPFAPNEDGTFTFQLPGEQKIR
jgi:uncharacterized protein (DUF952 family)